MQTLGRHAEERDHMPIRSPRGPVATLLIVVGIAACRGAASGSGSESPAASPTPASRTATTTPAATPSTAGRLEDLVPDEVGGIKLTKESIAGADLGELDPEEAANIAKVLENVDGPLEAFSAVNGTAAGIAVGAWRVEGTDGRQLGEAFIKFVLGVGAAKVEDVTIGDKEMKQVTPASTTPLHVYVNGEVMFVVQADDPALVEEIFAALP